MRSLSTKFEIDYYYQISQIVDSSSLSRIQILSELQWAVNSRFGLMGGFTWDIQEGDSDPSIFLTISFSDPLNWSL